MNQAKDILILTGTPGAGKTTTAKALAATSGSPKVHLHCDDFWHFIKHGAIPPFLESAHKQNETVVKVLAQAAEGYAKGGYFVIVDGIVGPWFLDAFIGLSARLHYIVLQIDVDSAIARCQARGGDTLTDAQVIASLHRQLSSLGALNKHVLDIRSLSPELTLAAVVAAVESEKFLLNA
ncbi:MAG: AAA family ATPase [Comamonadaceae bacterium]|jgi:chloramphenicol 3-O-phosphotransferase|uniref:AAA family ATPase n=1 Tax=Hydrogenophaga borbori TaxID=2294117 RepID=A0A372EN12_9BURK|nr:MULTISPECIES: AAA family ATPase [Hydrogenophaga]NCT98523.1 AAA family ATPase [Comamonadaceae bacterium]RFP80995.1 AAA family ATPase [Hydrogenophaga borbori]WQB85535.1 AAA family ATPase [Hydrogenophaga sp. SNF1]